MREKGRLSKIKEGFRSVRFQWGCAVSGIYIVRTGLHGYDAPESIALALSMSPAASRTLRVDRSVWGGVKSRTG